MLTEIGALRGIALAALQAGLRERGGEASLDVAWRLLRAEELGVGEREAAKRRVNASKSLGSTV